MHTRRQSTNRNALNVAYGGCKPAKNTEQANIYRLGVTIINRFADARRAAGLTQKQAAQELRVRQSTIANWETGSRKPAYTFITAMARLYGCTTDYLLGVD